MKVGGVIEQLDNQRIPRGTVGRVIRKAIDSVTNCARNQPAELLNNAVVKECLERETAI